MLIIYRVKEPRLAGAHRQPPRMPSFSFRTLSRLEAALTVGQLKPACMADVSTSFAGIGPASRNTDASQASAWRRGAAGFRLLVVLK